MKVVLSLCTVALLALAACSKAESQNGLLLESKLPGRFGQLSNVVELDSGRVAFVDTRDKLFLTAAFASGDLDTLGTRVEAIKPDAAPGEYKFPGWVARLAGDTIGLVDFAAIRTTLWDAKGKPIRTLAIPPVGGQTPVLVYDGMGNGYKIDYKSILDPPPGQTTPAGQRVGAADRAGGHQGGHRRPARVAPVRRSQVRGAEAAGRDGVRAERLLRRAGERHRLGGTRAAQPGGLESARRHLARGQGTEVQRAAGDPGGQGPGAGAGAGTGQAVRHAAGAADRISLRRPPSRRSTSRWAGPTARSGSSVRARPRTRRSSTTSTPRTAPGSGRSRFRRVRRWRVSGRAGRSTRR